MRKLISSSLLVFFVWIFPLFLFSQNPFIDSLYQNYQTQTGFERLFSGYKYSYVMMRMDTALSSKIFMDIEEEMKTTELSESNKYFLLAIITEARGRIEQLKGDYTKSLDYYRAVYDLAEKVEDEKKYTLKGESVMAIGSYYSRQGLYDKSNKEYFRAIDFYEKGGMTGSLCYANLSQNYQKLMQFDSVLYFCDKALSSINHNTSTPQHYTFTFFKADAFNEMELPDSTIALITDDYLTRAKSIATSNYAHLNLELSMAHSLKGNFNKAQQLINTAKEIVESSTNYMLNTHLREAKYTLSSSSGDYKVAHDMLSEMKAHSDSTYKSKMKTAFLDLEMQYETQTKDFEIQTLENKNHHQNNMMKLGGSLFAVILGTLFFWFKNREEKIKAIQAKNNQQIRIASKYDETEDEIEDDFLKNLTQYIQKNLTNENLNVNDLVQHSGLNRNALNKKLKSLTNKTAKKLIREIRLEKAHILLLKNGKNVSEIAFEVGFKDPNYFSSCFREKFGFPPSEILKNSIK